MIVAMVSRQRANSRLTIADRPAARLSRWGWLVPVAVGLMVLGAVVSFNFTSWDDYSTLARNPAMLPPTAQSWGDAWSKPYMDLWVPLTSSIWLVLASLAVHTQEGRIELAPAWFHLANLLVHLATVAILYKLLHRIIHHTWAAIVGAVLFAIHPLQVETVAWTSGLKDLLAGFFAILSLWWYVAAVQLPQRSSARHRQYIFSCTVLVLGLLCKPSVMVVPVLAGVIDWLILRRDWRTVVQWVVPLLVIVIPFAIVARVVQPAHVAVSVAVPLWARPLIATDALAFYLYKLIWPVGLAVDYGRTPAAALASGSLWWTWIVPAVVGVLLLVFRRPVRMAVAGALMMVVGLLPVLGLTHFDFQAYSTVADHYMYLPMLGVAVVSAWAIKVSGRDSAKPVWRQKGVSVIAVVLLLFFAIRSSVQLFTWRDTSSLFVQVLRVNPNSWAAYTSLSVVASERGDVPRALDLAREAARINPNNANVQVNLASALTKAGQTAQAIEHYQEAVKIEPGNASALASMGGLLAQSGQVEQAERVLKQALGARPNDATARLNLGTLYATQGRLDPALAELELAVRYDPNNPQALANYGTVLMMSDQPEAAEAQFRRALLIRPGFAPAVNGMKALGQ